MGNGRGAVAPGRRQNRIHTVKLAVMLPALQRRDHLVHQIVDVQQLQLYAGVVHRDGQVVGIVVAEGGHGGIVVGTAPFSEQVGEAVHQHFCPGFGGIREKQLLPRLLAPAVLAARIAPHHGRLNGGRQHHGAGVTVLFQRVQQRGSKAEISLHELFLILRAVDAGKIEHEVRLPAGRFQQRRVGVDVVEVQLPHRKSRMGLVTAVPDALQRRRQIFAHKSGRAGNQNVHAIHPSVIYSSWLPVLPGCSSGSAASAAPAPRSAAPCCCC